MTEDSADRVPPLRERLSEGMRRAASLVWVPLAASALSLVLSIASIVVATRDPEVVVLLPPTVRIAQGEEVGFAYLYLQPSFVSTGVNDRVEVIPRMSLDVRRTDGGGQPTEFTWNEEARLVYDAETGEVDYEYVADPVPLLVSPTRAQSPLGLFQAPAGWYFEPGTYSFILRADRVTADRGLESRFEVTLTPAQVEELNASGGRRYLAFPLAEPS